MDGELELIKALSRAITLRGVLQVFSVTSTTVDSFPVSTQAHVSSWPLGLALLEELQGDIVSMLLNMCTSESHLSVWG